MIFGIEWAVGSRPAGSATWTLRDVFGSFERAMDALPYRSTPQLQVIWRWRQADGPSAWHALAPESPGDLELWLDAA